MLRTRVITAIIALSLLFSIFMYGTKDFIRFFFAGLVFVGTYEIAAMLFPAIYSHSGFTKEKLPSWWVFFVTVLATTLYIGSVQFSGSGIGILTFGLLGCILLGIFLVPSFELAYLNSTTTLLCVAYGVLPWLSIWELYGLKGDFRYVSLMCAVVWCGDTGAYFAGKAFGRRKLAPKISPNKTWEGAIGGLLASLCAGLLTKCWFGADYISWGLVGVTSVVGGAFGQLGDLAESSFKRYAGVKDSGRIFPGHGGFLDRVDGLLFAAPVIWIIILHFGS